MLQLIVTNTTKDKRVFEFQRSRYAVQSNPTLIPTVKRLARHELSRQKMSFPGDTFEAHLYIVISNTRKGTKWRAHWSKSDTKYSRWKYHGEDWHILPTEEDW